MGDDAAQQMYTGMLDQQLAVKMAASGTGLADVIAKQLTRHMAAAGDAVAAPADRAVTPAQAPTRPATRSGTPAADAARTATDAGSASAPAPGAAQRAFVQRHWDHALAAERVTGIPAKFIVAQAAHESGWGGHEIRGADGLPSFNLFGIKAGGAWKGRTVDVVTTEYEHGEARKVVAKFRAYNNYGEAFRDWARLLAGSPRYAQVVARGADAGGFAFGLQRAGYATDPNYGEKLERAIGTVSGVRGAA
jgi:flagellar protein FlgJ